MKLPKKIKILYRDYAVHEYTSKQAATDGNYGKCNNTESIIYVDLKWDNQKVALTMLHEIMHATSYLMAIEAKELTCDEDMVGPMANGLATVMRDNPGVFQEILKNLQ